MLFFKNKSGHLTPHCIRVARSLEPLRAYGGEDVRLTLPGGRSAFDVDWLALWDARGRAALAAALLPAAPNVPPAAARALPAANALPACRQLHRDYQASWEIHGNQITVQLAALVTVLTSILTNTSYLIHLRFHYICLSH